MFCAATRRFAGDCGAEWVGLASEAKLIVIFSTRSAKVGVPFVEQYLYITAT